jgi:hypothetical protein
VVGNDFQIIDFEGDPATSLAERRRKHSPLRDVARMLVSFGHAIRSALMDLGAERAGHSNRLEPWVRLWEQRTRRVFLDGCAEGVCGAASYPENEEHARALIELISPGRPALAAGLSTRRRPCTGRGRAIQRRPRRPGPNPPGLLPRLTLQLRTRTSRRTEAGFLAFCSGGSFRKQYIQGSRIDAQVRGQ